MQSITVTGTYNVRDLGGYITVHGTQTKRQMLIRSGNLDKIPVSSQRQLIDYGVTTVIDIRDEWEAEHYPNVFANSSTIKYLNLPLIGDALSNDETWQRESENYIFLHELYINYLERCKSQIKAIFTAISQSKSTTIFHCHAGKDRTGIITALLLSSLGVQDHDIAEDYSLSNQQITHLIADWREYAVQKGQDMKHFEVKIASSPETIIEMLNYIQKKYGSTAGYLQSCDISDDVINQLQGHFTE
jgi:protein-tyrosine phosphatase